MSFHRRFKDLKCSVDRVTLSRSDFPFEILSFFQTEIPRFVFYKTLNKTFTSSIFLDVLLQRSSETVGFPCSNVGEKAICATLFIFLASRPMWISSVSKSLTLVHVKSRLNHSPLNEDLLKPFLIGDTFILFVKIKRNISH